MNKVIIMGRLTRDPEVRYTDGADPMAIARFAVAVDRKGQKQEGQQNADFPSCVAFGKLAEFCEKWISRGTKVVITGRIQTGSYTNRDGQKAYTTDVVCEEIEFAESKSAAQQSQQGSSQNSGQRRSAGQRATMPTDADGFMNIPDGIDEELPFN